MLKTKIRGAVENHYFSSARNNKFKQKKEMSLLMTEANEEYLFSVCFIRIRLKQG